MKDIVAMTIAALKSGKSGVWNAGSGQPRSFNEMIEGLNKVLKTKFKRIISTARILSTNRIPRRTCRRPSGT